MPSLLHEKSLHDKGKLPGERKTFEHKKSQNRNGKCYPDEM